LNALCKACPVVFHAIMDNHALTNFCEAKHQKNWSNEKFGKRGDAIADARDGIFDLVIWAYSEFCAFWES
jgi:hypothetical protein